MPNTQPAANSPVSAREVRPRDAVPFRYILGMRVDCTTYAKAADQIALLGDEGRGGYVCVANVHMVMEAFDDPGFRAAVNSADLVTSDGTPLVWALRLLGLPQAERVYGPTLTPLVCQRAADWDIPVGFYGGDPEVLGRLWTELSRRFPKLEVVYAHSPPFRPLTPEEDRDTVIEIRASGAKILFVGLGCPKQERWMAEHRSSLPCAMVGVGAAFDFLAGVKAQAPAWMQRGGLEWLFRLACEPRRLWRRYLYNNPRFVYEFIRERLRHRDDNPARL